MSPGDKPVGVVVVSDHRLFTDTFTEGLRRTSEARVVAVSGSWCEALDLISHADAAVAVLCPYLKDDGSFQFLRNVKKLIPRTRVIVIDNEAHFAIAREAIRLGAAGYFTHEDPLDEVTRGITGVTRGEYAFCAAIANSVIETKDGPRLVADIAHPELMLLTERELDVLMCIVMGDSVKAAAKRLDIAASTVDNHKTRLMRKLNAHRTYDLVKLAIRERLVPG